MSKFWDAFLTTMLIGLIEFMFCLIVGMLITLLHNYLIRTNFFARVKKNNKYVNLYYFIFGFILSSIIIVCTYFLVSVVCPDIFVLPTITLCLILVLSIKNNANIALGAFLPTVIFTMCLCSNNFTSFSSGSLFRILIVFYFILASCMGNIFRRNGWITIAICCVSVFVLSCIFIPFEQEIYGPYFICPMVLGLLFPFAFYPLSKQWDKVLLKINTKKA